VSIFFLDKIKLYIVDAINHIYYTKHTNSIKGTVMQQISIQRIKAEIAASEVTQSAIAKKLGLSIGTIAQQLKPSGNTGVKHLNKIIEAYNELKENVE
jgi:hypothetical protein